MLSSGDRCSDVVFYTESELEFICREARRVYGNGAPVYRYGEAIVLLANTGMRVGELLALNWNSVNEVNKKIVINGNAVSVKKRKGTTPVGYETLIQSSTKTAAGQRYYSRYYRQ